MKNLFFLLLFAITAIFFTNCSSDESGNNSVEFIISTPDELNNIRNNLSGKYRLDGDIDLSVSPYDSGWIPIGSATAPFVGVLEGDGFKIEGFNVPSAYSAGLFAYVGSGAIIKNLTIEISTNGVNGTTFAGALAGNIIGTPENNVIVTNVNVAGADVRAEDMLYDGESNAGGLAGYLEYANLSYCYNMSNVSTTAYRYAYSGGIAGEINYSSIRNSYNTGNISAASDSGGHVDSGGIVGYANYFSSISASYNTGIISALAYGLFSGGIAGGIINYSSISNSYNTGNISITATGSVIPAGGINIRAGGIVGYGGNMSETSDSYNTGNISTTSVSGNIYSGGIAADAAYSSKISNNVAINETIAATITVPHLGRVVGINSNADITNNFANSSMLLNGSTTGDDESNGIGKNFVSDFQDKSIYENAIVGNGDGGLGWLFGSDNDNPWVWDAFPGVYLYPTLYWQTEAPMP